MSALQSLCECLDRLAEIDPVRFTPQHVAAQKSAARIMWNRRGAKPVVFGFWLQYRDLLKRKLNKAD